MRTEMTKKLCVALALAVLPLSAFANHSGLPSSPDRSFEAQFSPPSPSISTQLHHLDNILSLCENSMTQLRYARTKASWEAASGRLSYASEILYQGLISAVSDANQWHANPAPHLEAAVRAGLNIAELLRGYSRENLAISLSTQVLYLGLSGIYETVESAYVQLDQPWYPRFGNYCDDYWSHRCWQDRFPLEYFNGVARLAKLFIDNQIQLGEYMASNKVEFGVTSSVLAESRTFLMNYLGRRSLCGVLSRIDATIASIRDFLSGSTGLPSRNQIEYVRHALRDISHELDSKLDRCN